jgi:hypothetical protein
LIHQAMAWVEKTLITPPLCEKMLTEWVFYYQRDIKPWIVDRYRLSILNDLFSVSQIDVAVVQGKDHYLINGYHRLKAVIQACKPLWQNICFHPCDTYGDVVELYQGMDPQTGRSTGDILKAMGMDKVIGVPVPRLRRGLAALRIIGNGFRSTRGGRYGWDSIDQQLTALWLWRDQIKSYCDLLPKETNQMSQWLERSGIMATGLVIFADCMETYPGAVNDFWGNVSNLRGPVGYPPLVLGNYLMAQDKLPSNRQDPPHIQARKAASAWAHHVREQPISKLMGSAEDTVIKITGTRFNGRIEVLDKFVGEGPDFQGWEPKEQEVRERREREQREQAAKIQRAAAEKAEKEGS